METSSGWCAARPNSESGLIQVGFMRRFDHEYAQLKSLIDSGGEAWPSAGAALYYRNPSVPPHFDSAMTVKDSLVHEVDVTRFLLGEEITSIQVITPTPNSLAAEGLSDPQTPFSRPLRAGTSMSSCSSPPGWPTRCALNWWPSGVGVHRSGRRAGRRAPGVWGTITPSFKGAVRPGLRHRRSSAGSTR